jgi:hypothetical protein
MRDLNRALLRLEINGLVTVTWISKDVRRVELGFRGVAFGRIGGFNVRVELDPESRAALERMGLGAAQIEELEVVMQRMIVEGRFESSPEAVQHEHRFP